MAFLVVVTILLSGCTNTVIRPVTLPKAFKPNRGTIEWLVSKKAPDYVINDMVDCVAQGEIIQETSKQEAVTSKNWDAMSTIKIGWSALTSWW